MSIAAGASGTAGGNAQVAAHSTYSSLVESDDDLIGHVAYALYKRDKLKFCDSVHQKHGRMASTQELETFIHAAGMPTRIRAYRAEAELLLESFSEEMLDLATQDIQAEYHKKLTQELKQAKSISRSIIDSTIGNLLSIAVVALLVVIIYGTRIGFLPLLNDIFGAAPNGTPTQQGVADER